MKEASKQAKGVVQVSIRETKEGGCERREEGTKETMGLKGCKDTEDDMEEGAGRKTQRDRESKARSNGIGKAKANGDGKRRGTNGPRNIGA